MTAPWMAKAEVALATIGGAAVEFILADPGRLLEFHDWMARLGVDMPPELMRRDLETVLSVVPLVGKR